MKLEIVDVKKVPVSEIDILTVAEMEVHSEIRKWDTDYVHHSSDQHENVQGFRRFFHRVPGDENQLCLLAKLGGKVVGFLGIHCFDKPRSHVGDVGIMVHPDYQCKGIGTTLLKAGIDLAREKGFKRLEADTLAENKAMRRTAGKAGFQLEGLRRKAMNMHGQFKDEALYALLL